MRTRSRGLVYVTMFHSSLRLRTLRITWDLRPKFRVYQSWLPFYLSTSCFLLVFVTLSSPDSHLSDPSTVQKVSPETAKFHRNHFSTVVLPFVCLSHFVSQSSSVFPSKVSLLFEITGSVTMEVWMCAFFNPEIVWSTRNVPDRRTLTSSDRDAGPRKIDPEFGSKVSSKS